MTQSLVQGIIDALSGSVGKEAIVFIISMIPDSGTSWSTSCSRTASWSAGLRKRFHYVFLGILYRFRLSCF